MPSQHALSAKLYSLRKKSMLADPQLSREDRAWFLSCSQFNAGSWLHAIPSIRRFKCGSAEFKTMLQIRLGLYVAHTEHITECKCGAKADTSFRNARHWMTWCPKGRRILLHNRTRNVIAAMYKALGVAAETEVKGLYLQLTSYGAHRPADVLVPSSSSGDGVAWALDVAYTDPTCATAIQHNSDTRALSSAKARHSAKMATHAKALNAAGAAGLPFKKKPLVFETTGAMGQETQKWWKAVLAIEAALRTPGDTTSRRDLGLEHTFSANGFATYWLQSISLSYARSQAESIMVWVGRNAPASSAHDTDTSLH